MSSNIMAITYEDAIAVTASDTVADPSGPFAGFYVGVAGTVKLTTVRGTAATFLNCQAGVVYTVACSRIWSSVTTATNILGMVAMPYKAAFNPGAGTVLP